MDYVLDEKTHGYSTELPEKRIKEGGYIWANQVARLILQFKVDSVLDIGCQIGQLIYSLKKNNFLGKYKGVDISQFYINKAKEKFPKDNFMICSIENPEDICKQEAYDAVVCSSVLEYTNDHWLVGTK